MVFAESVLGYGSFLYGMDEVPKTTKEEFRRLYRKSLKYSLGLNKNSPSDVVAHIAGIITPEMMIDVRFLCVAGRLLQERGYMLDRKTRERLENKVNALKQGYGFIDIQNLTVRDMRRRLLERLYK